MDVAAEARLGVADEDRDEPAGVQGLDGMAHPPHAGTLVEEVGDRVLVLASLALEANDDRLVLLHREPRHGDVPIIARGAEAGKWPGERRVKRQADITVGRIVRLLFGSATVALLLFAFGVGRDARLFAAAAVCGTVWWVWDLLTSQIFIPLGDWLTQTVVGGGLGDTDSSARPGLDDLIRLLEGHLEHGASRHVDINAAIRLEEIYRTVKRNPEAARRVMEIVLRRYPDAPELERFRKPTQSAVPDVGTEEPLPGTQD
jgi:hypothetical protein